MNQNKELKNGDMCCYKQELDLFLQDGNRTGSSPENKWVFTGRSHVHRVWWKHKVTAMPPPIMKLKKIIIIRHKIL